jgi:uncharacterized protein (DUF983 family)
MTPDERPIDPAGRLVDAGGLAIRRPSDARCPRCSADPASRVASGGFGRPHDVCSQCGFEFAEYTAAPERTP